MQLFFNLIYTIEVVTEIVRNNDNIKFVDTGGDQLNRLI